MFSILLLTINFCNKKWLQLKIEKLIAIENRKIELPQRTFLWPSRWFRLYIQLALTGIASWLLLSSRWFRHFVVWNQKRNTLKHFWSLLRWKPKTVHCIKIQLFFQTSSNKSKQREKLYFSTAKMVSKQNFMDHKLCELIAQNFVSISFLIARNPERSGPFISSIMSPNITSKIGKIWWH